MISVILLGVIIALLVVFLVDNSKSETGWNFRAFAQVRLSGRIRRAKSRGLKVESVRQAAVSTNGQECAQIGANVLAKDGSAVDAAIAALLCEGVASLHR